MHERERVEDLQLRGLKILRRTDLPGYSADAVLLADFARPKAGARVIDIGTGTGILPLLLLGREAALAITAVEVDASLADLAARSMALNGLEGQVEVLQLDARKLSGQMKADSFDMVICNPPYHKGAGRPDKHQATFDYEDLAVAAAGLLGRGGRLCCCFPAAHLLPMSDTLRRHRLEPKRLQLVSSVVGRSPYLCLVEARLGGNPGLRWEPSLALQENDGSMSAEARAIYHIGEDNS